MGTTGQPRRTASRTSYRNRKGNKSATFACDRSMSAPSREARRALVRLASEDLPGDRETRRLHDAGQVDLLARFGRYEHLAPAHLLAPRTACAEHARDREPPVAHDREADLDRGGVDGL